MEDQGARFIQRFSSGFAADMKREGIHVGLGSPPRCCNCGEKWPCAGSADPKDSTASGRSGRTA